MVDGLRTAVGRAGGFATAGKWEVGAKVGLGIRKDGNCLPST